MARGPRKSIEEKIEAKRELIDALEVRLDSERAELEELLKEKRWKELETVGDLIEESGLDPSSVAEILKEYVKDKQSAEYKSAHPLRGRELLFIRFGIVPVRAGPFVQRIASA